MPYHLKIFSKTVLIIPRPIFRSTPPLVSGTPVLWAIELFKPVIPINRLREKDIPNFFPNPNMRYYL